MKRIVLLALVLVILFSFCSCMYDQSSYKDGDDTAPFNSFYYSNFWGDAYVGYYIWDGTEEGKTIVIPENYKDYPVTMLGGYFGRGYPTPFYVSFAAEVQELLFPNAYDWWRTWVQSYPKTTSNGVEPSDVQYITFNIHLSKNIKEFKNTHLDDVFEATYEDNGETKKIALVYTYHFTCDENNETFYAKDGKIYYRKDDTLVERILYEDFDLIEYFQDMKDSTT